MILPDYSSFRAVFTTGGTDVSGYPTFDRDNFDTISLQMSANPLAVAFPFQLNIIAATTPLSIYLSQGTDDPTKQLFSMVETTGDLDYVQIYRTALNVALFPTVNPDSIAAMFRNTYIYVRDNNDKTVMGDFTRAIFADIA